MADTTQFGHDQLGHLLADYLLEVPRFQRSYSWDQGNVEEYLADLASARNKDVDYFMGTVVFASPDKEGGRKQIVDGQQRLATTAILITALRDQLLSLGRQRQAEEVEKRFLRGYVIAIDDVVERLILSPNDLSAYQKLLDRDVASVPEGSLIRRGYEACLRHVADLAADPSEADILVQISQQLEERVQVLVAEASDLPEAYVIFETLNDRGADLTTADLLKNYLFSAAKDYFHFVEHRWAQLEGSFDRPEDLVKFIRYDHVSRHGSVSARKLYRAIQSEVGGSAKAVKTYIEHLVEAQEVYQALREPEHPFWSSVNVNVRDALQAFRRFRFEASTPVLLAAFSKWTKDDAARLLIKIANWSVRGQFTGRLGGGVADETYGDTAKAISDGIARNQPDVRIAMSRIVPNDAEFESAFVSSGDVTVSRAKYLLAMLEKAADAKHQRPVRSHEWHSRAVTIEHVMSLAGSDQSDAKAAAVNRLGNLPLLEKRLNVSAGSKPFSEKRPFYKESAFELTRQIAAKRTWGLTNTNRRASELAELACLAWPLS